MTTTAQPGAWSTAADVDQGQDKVSPGASWHWELLSRVIAGLRAASGERGPCSPDTLAAADAVMVELEPLTELLAHTPRPQAPQAPQALPYPRPAAPR